MRCFLGYITTSSLEEAKKIARHLLERRLIACANIYPQVESMFWWEGKIDKATEVVLIIKTSGHRLAEIEKEVLKIHSYNCPCVVFLPIHEGHGPFLEWIQQEIKEEN
ncbi:MAG: divalent-cation tolerance protein CutA [Desulfonauticus sp.]|nr:divalent-cation tolerance protein CutA [Desulfonauticus sp.]